MDHIHVIKVGNESEGYSFLKGATMDFCIDECLNECKEDSGNEINNQDMDGVGLLNSKELFGMKKVVKEYGDDLKNILSETGYKVIDMRGTK